MLKAIENIMLKGNFAGCNLVLKKGNNDNLNVILSFLLPSSVNDDVTMKHSEKSVNDSLDNIVNLRALLTRPIVAVGSVEELPEKLEQAIFERTEAMIEGATALSSLDIAALIKQSTGKITTLPVKKKEAQSPKPTKGASDSGDTDVDTDVDADVDTDVDTDTAVGSDDDDSESEVELKAKPKKSNAKSSTTKVESVDNEPKSSESEKEGFSKYLQDFNDF